MAKLELRLNPDNTDARTHQSIAKVASRKTAINDPKVRIIHFLRAASGRASIALGAFYLHLAATHAGENFTKHSYRVKQATIRYSALWTIALCVRSIFDEEGSHPTRLNAKTLVKASDPVRQQVAEFWAQRDAQKRPDAQLALAFIARLLERAAIPIKEAAKSGCVLTRRIALIKAVRIGRLRTFHWAITNMLASI
jgi:hypothetical protein